MVGDSVVTAFTPDGLARIEELAEKATPGPWFREYGDVVVAADDPRDRLKDEPRSLRVFEAAANWNLRDPQPIADAKFVVEARTAVPALVAGVRSRDERIAELEAEVAARDAVIAKVKEFAGDADEYDDGINEWPAPIVLFDALSAAPESVLACVKAEALEEAANASRTENGEGDLLTSSWLRDRAAEYRKQADQ